MKKKSIRESKVDKIINIVNSTILSVILVLFIFPLIFVISASFSDPSAVWGGEVWLFPVDFTLIGYEEILSDMSIWRGYLNTIIYTTVGTYVNIIVTITCAYPLSRKDFVARGFLMKFYMFTMFFSGGLIATYILVDDLHLLDTMWSIILPGAASVTNIIISRTFFQHSIPISLQEAAFLDGCTNINFLKYVVLPLSKPIIAVMALYYGVGHWNSFFNAMIYIQDSTKYPLQLILREIVLGVALLASEPTEDAALMAQQSQMAEIIKYGVIVVSSLPAMIIYPFLQKYFVKGVMIGSIKE